MEIFLPAFKGGLLASVDLAATDGGKRCNQHSSVFEVYGGSSLGWIFAGTEERRLKLGIID
jgi:hypothetical protein